MSLIITCPRNFEEKAGKEISEFIKDVTDTDPKISSTDLSGIFIIHTNTDPIELIEKFKQKIDDEPWSIRFCSRLIPIHDIVESKLDVIKQGINKLLNVINPNDTFRITIENRNSSLSTSKIISEIGEIIPNKVSLEKPDWEILVEILGGKTGIAVLPKNSILSVQKIKREFSDQD